MLEFARSLPLTLEDFNVRSSLEGFATFYSGDNRTYYDAILTPEGEIAYSQKLPRDPSSIREVFTLQRGDFLPVVEEYERFVVQEWRLGKYHKDLPIFLSRLGGFNFR